MPIVEAPHIATAVAIAGYGDLLVVTGLDPDAGNVKRWLLVYQAEREGAIGPPEETGRREESERVAPSGENTEQRPAVMGIRFDCPAAVDQFIATAESIKAALIAADTTREEASE